MASITKRGPGCWRVQIRRKGAASRYKTFECYEDARRWAEQAEGLIASGDDLDLSEARRTSLGEALERHLAEVTPAKKGAKQETIRIRAWMRDPLADRPLASIRTADLAAWRNDRLAQGKAPTTIRNALTSIDGRVCQRPSECGAPFDRNRGLTRFLVRGAAKVKAVVLWLALANNLSCGWRLGAA